MFFITSLALLVTLAYIVAGDPPLPQEGIFNSIINATQPLANATFASNSTGIKICSEATSNGTCVTTHPLLWDPVTKALDCAPIPFLYSGVVWMAAGPGEVCYAYLNAPDKGCNGPAFGPITDGESFGGPASGLTGFKSYVCGVPWSC